MLNVNNAQLQHFYGSSSNVCAALNLLLASSLRACRSDVSLLLDLLLGRGDRTLFMLARRSSFVWFCFLLLLLFVCYFSFCLFLCKVMLICMQLVLNTVRFPLKRSFLFYRSFMKSVLTFYIIAWFGYNLSCMNQLVRVNLEVILRLTVKSQGGVGSKFW